MMIIKCTPAELQQLSQQNITFNFPVKAPHVSKEHKFEDLLKAMEKKVNQDGQNPMF